MNKISRRAFRIKRLACTMEKRCLDDAVCCRFQLNLLYLFVLVPLLTTAEDVVAVMTNHHVVCPEYGSCCNPRTCVTRVVSDGKQSSSSIVGESWSCSEARRERETTPFFVPCDNHQSLNGAITLGLTCGVPYCRTLFYRSLGYDSHSCSLLMYTSRVARK